MWNSPANTENRAKLHRYPPKLTGILSQEAKPRGTKYRSISVILHEAAPNVISRDNKQGKHPKWNIPHIPRAGKGRLRPQAQGMCGIFHEGLFLNPISQGNGGYITRFSVSPGEYCMYCWPEVVFIARNRMILKNCRGCILRLQRQNIEYCPIYYENLWKNSAIYYLMNFDYTCIYLHHRAINLNSCSSTLSEHLW